MGGRIFDLPKETERGGGPTREVGEAPRLKRWIKEKDWERVIEENKWKTRSRKGYIS